LVQDAFHLIEPLVAREALNEIFPLHAWHGSLADDWSLVSLSATESGTWRTRWSGADRRG
jgi:hypothetical protein